MNQSFKYKFNEVKFYDYTIRMTVVNNTDMYLVSDLLKQYNKINNTNKRMNNWFRRIDTLELLNSLRKFSDASKSAPEVNEENNDEFTDIPNVIMKNVKNS